jgi:hypothetical protein
MHHGAARPFSFLLILSALVLQTGQASGQGGPTAPRDGVRITRTGTTDTIRAVRATGPIRVDGRLDEPAWAVAPPASNFVQRDPDEGEPGSERTEVRVLYDDDALYIGGRMFESDPSRIRARLARRDEPIWNADVLEFYIDSRNDGLSAFVFRITPAGALRDATMDANLGQDNSWDAVWEGAASMDSLGWSAEVRIPFGQLRYSTAPGDSVWGIMFLRLTAWRGEWAYLPARPKAAVQRPADFARLVGLSELPRRREVELIPYAAARASRLERQSGNPFRTGTQSDVSVGADLRYGLTSNLTLSATVNPDFGQVEVDPARINLTQNELFFPERRPFFVESAETFRFGQARVGSLSPLTFHSLGNISAMSGVLNPSSFEAFHSRRIGRVPQRDLTGQYDFVEMPEDVTIGGAAKLTGRTTRGLSLGLLDAVTAREQARVFSVGGVPVRETVEPQTNYLVARARQEMREGNTVLGGLLTAVNRDMSDAGTAAVLRRDAYFTGIDLQHSWLQRMWSFDAALGQSVVAGTPEAIALTQRSPVRYLQRPDRETMRFDPARRRLSGTTAHVGLARNAGQHWVGNVFYRGVSPGLEVNDVGFQTLAGFHSASWSVAYKEDAPGRLLRNYLFRPYGFAYWNWDGFLGRNVAGLSAEATLSNFWQILIRPEVSDGRLDAFLSRGGPVMRRADANRLEIALLSDRRTTLTTDLGYTRETEEIGSWHHQFSSTFDWRPIQQLRVALSPGYAQRVNRAQHVAQFADADAAATFDRRYVFGSLRYRELSVTSRLDWTFSPRLSLQLFAQPLAAAGEFLDLKALASPGTLDFLMLGEAEGTLARNGQTVTFFPAGAAFTIRDPNFKTRTLVGNAVARWEYRPGSALFFVWQQRRAGIGDDFGLHPTRDIREVFSDRPQNIFAVKGTYWLRW